MPFQPLIGQIVLLPYTFAPRGWAVCAGQLLSISQNTALFSILGTNFGGDGRSTFGLPDLRSRIPVGVGQGNGLAINYVVGEQDGVENVTINSSTMPSHSHTAVGSNNPANFSSPGGESWAADGAGICTQYAPSPNAQMSPLALSAVGSGFSHNNIMPVLAVQYCIALVGIFPARN